MPMHRKQRAGGAGDSQEGHSISQPAVFMSTSVSASASRFNTQQHHLRSLTAKEAGKRKPCLKVSGMKIGCIFFVARFPPFFSYDSTVAGPPIYTGPRRTAHREHGGQRWSRGSFPPVWLLAGPPPARGGGASPPPPALWRPRLGDMARVVWAKAVDLHRHGVRRPVYVG